MAHETSNAAGAVKGVGRGPSENQWRWRQDDYRAAQERVDAFERSMSDRYGVPFSTCRSWLKNAERKRWGALCERRDRIGDQIIEYLYQYSPRHTAWGSGVPLVWICTELSFEDALTAGALSVVPPAAYGQTEAGRRAFAQEVRSHVA